MKRLFFVLILLTFAASLYAGYAGKSFYFRRGGVTYSLRLYTTSAEVPTPRLCVRSGTSTYYAALGTTTRADATTFRARVSGVTYAGIKYGSRTEIASPSLAACSDGTYYYVAGGYGYLAKTDSNGSVVANRATGLGSGDDGWSDYLALACDGTYLYILDSVNSKFKVYAASNLAFVYKFNSIPAASLACTSGGKLLASYYDGVKHIQVWNGATWEAGFGANGTGNGQFTSVSGVAVAPDGNVWAGDHAATDRVQKFNSSFAYSSQFSLAAGSGAGQIRSNYYWKVVAADSEGIYICDFDSDGTNGRIQKFNTSGTYLHTLGSGADSTSEWGTIGPERSIGGALSGSFCAIASGSAKFTIFK